MRTEDIPYDIIKNVIDDDVQHRNSQKRLAKMTGISEYQVRKLQRRKFRNGKRKTITVLHYVPEGRIKVFHKNSGPLKVFHKL